MSSTATEQTFYLDGGTEPVCAVFHPPAPAAARDTAVLLCPPFGWDEVCSYRSRREWAQRLAAAGYPTVRLSYPGTGDSGGAPGAPGAVETWADAVAQAVAWARRATGVKRLSAIGIELGGLIAYRAASAGAEIDDLVLWATPARAKALTRQLRAFSALELSQFYEGLEPPPPLPTGELHAGGFLLSAETVRALDQLNLTELPLQDPASRRVLLLERDGITVDARLHERLRSIGVPVTVAPGPGYASMTSHPQRAEPPREVIERVMAWLNEASAPTSRTAEPAAPAAAGAHDTARLSVGGADIKETPLVIEQSFGRIAGVLTEPLGAQVPGACVVFLNAGAVRRIGPNRMWVEAARRWAARGVRTVRLDVEGIGDADGETTPYASDSSLYVPQLTAQVRGALEDLYQRGIGERFVLVGLCAGAYWSFHLALQDPRVSAALMMNPRALIWDPELLPARDFRALRSQPLSLSKLHRLATAARIRALARWMLAAPRRWLSRRRRASTETETLERVLKRLRTSGKRALLLFSDHEPLRDELASSGALAQLERWANVTIEYIPVRDHTLRPHESQRQAHAALDRALDLELGSPPVREPVTSVS